MTRKDLIEKIVMMLFDNDALDVRSYANNLDQLDHVQYIISKALDGYVLVKGEVI